MSAGADETAKAFHELLETVREREAAFRDGERAVSGEASLLEGYKWAFSILRVGLDAFVWADVARPRFVDIVGPYTKWGGDNADAFYQYAPVDPTRTYRVRGRKGDAVYLSLTVYGGPDDGRWSERIVGSLNDREFECDADGCFEIVLSPDEHSGNWIRLEPDSVCAITRDYLVDPFAGRRAEWRIEAEGDAPEYRQTDADLARRFRAAATFVRDQASIAPLPPAEPNVIQDPYPVPKVTFGWAAGDAAYAMGAFELGEDEALVIRGRSPACAFWNLCLWNPFMHTYNYDYDRVTLNGGQALLDEDGSWTVVVAARDPGHPNWVSCQGHRAGRIWIRWFLPEKTPEPLQTRVVPLAEVPSS